MIEDDHMNQDNFNQKIIDALNQKAHQQQKQEVIDQVLIHIEEAATPKYNRHLSIGLALAAAITGLSIIPGIIMTELPNSQDTTAQTPKLSPQLADDLEMLLVLGEDTVHDS